MPDSGRVDRRVLLALLVLLVLPAVLVAMSRSDLPAGQFKENVVQ